MLATKDIAWAAGFLEGEGSFVVHRDGRDNSSGIQIQAVQVQLEPLERMRYIFGGSIHARETLGHLGKQQQYIWRINGLKAAAIMMTLYILMSPRRREQIEIALLAWRQQKRNPGSPFCFRRHDKRIVGDHRGRCLECNRITSRDRRVVKSVNHQLAKGI